jgi:hypothetical protein
MDTYRAHAGLLSSVSISRFEMIYPIWMVGASGYYSSLVVWIIAQRSHHLHGKYSHSWAISVLLLTFAGIQIVTSLSSLIILTGLIALIMPAIVTVTDLNDHRKSGRGLFEHQHDCWMKQTMEDDLPIAKTEIAQ